MARYFEDECSKQGGQIYLDFEFHQCTIPHREEEVIPVDKLLKLRDAALRGSRTGRPKKYKIVFYDPDTEYAIVRYKLERSFFPREMFEELEVSFPMTWEESMMNFLDSVTRWLNNKKKEHDLPHADIWEGDFRGRITIYTGLKKKDESKEILLNMFPTLEKIRMRAIEESRKSLKTPAES